MKKNNFKTAFVETIIPKEIIPECLSIFKEQCIEIRIGDVKRRAFQTTMNYPIYFKDITEDICHGSCFISLPHENTILHHNIFKELSSVCFSCRFKHLWLVLINIELKILFSSSSIIIFIHHSLSRIDLVMLFRYLKECIIFYVGITSTSKTIGWIFEVETCYGRRGNACERLGNSTERAKTSQYNLHNWNFKMHYVTKKFWI